MLEFVLAEVQQAKSVQAEPTTTDLITLLGIIVTLIISIFSIWVNMHRNRVDGVTKNRVEWIEKVRNIVAEIARYDYDEKGANADNDKIAKDCNALARANENLMKNAHSLFMYLNVLGKFDCVASYYLKHLVDNRKKNISNTDHYFDFVEAKRLFLLTMRIYLKAEWDRVKWENRVVKWHKFNENKSIKKIIKKLDETDDFVKKINSKYKEYLEIKKTKPLFPTIFVYAKGSSNLKFSTVTNAKMESKD